MNALRQQVVNLANQIHVMRLELSQLRAGIVGGLDAGSEAVEEGPRPLIHSSTAGFPLSLQGIYRPPDRLRSSSRVRTPHSPLMQAIFESETQLSHQRKQPPARAHGGIQVLAHFKYADHNEVSWTDVCNGFSNEDEKGSSQNPHAAEKTFFR
ncbi:hypothetical protein FPANT_5163 [Fusarium pseudoanthophilum]|uniref:Uncharacterized protein n=1 Tax=Fusarium pseudoanthophilum TaxID=48495 RepID=A0A8H5JR84_9HYPO|nr:hypothetical protein FPANT_14297 [Fusarium pseudoanthophilum]KAF5593233.1 hypothetical protein FPANT_5163 [Fusarium pseudoanthophilum]